VVLPDHGVRRPAAGRHGAAGGPLARQGPDDAAELDRPFSWRRRPVRDRGARRPGDDLHHAPGHPVRRDVLRRRRGLRPGVGAGGGDAGAGGVRGVPGAGPADQ
jgi:hypothetical protein